MTNQHSINLEMFPNLQQEEMTSGHLIIEAESVDQEATFLLDTSEDAIKAGNFTQAHMAMSRADTLVGRGKLLHRFLSLLSTENEHQDQRMKWVAKIVHAGEHTSNRMVDMLDQHWIDLQRQAPKEVSYGARYWIYAAFTIQAHLATAEMLQEYIQQHPEDPPLQNIALQAIEFALDDTRHKMREMYNTDPNTVILLPNDTLANFQNDVRAADVTIQRIMRTELRGFNERLPNHHSPITATLPEDIIGHLNTLSISPTKMSHLALDADEFPDEIKESRSLFVAYYHDQTREIKAATEPFPKGYPSYIATRQVSNLITELAQTEEPAPDHALSEALMAMQLIELQIHDTNAQDIAVILEPLLQRETTRQHAARIVRAICQTPEIINFFQRTGKIPDCRVTSKQADAIIKAAINARIQPAQLHELALHLGHNPLDMGIDPTPIPLDQKDLIIERAQQAGFKHQPISRLVTYLL